MERLSTSISSLCTYISKGLTRFLSRLSRITLMGNTSTHCATQEQLYKSNPSIKVSVVLSFTEYLKYLEHVTSINIVLMDNGIEIIEDDSI